MFNVQHNTAVNQSIIMSNVEIIMKTGQTQKGIMSCSINGDPAAKEELSEDLKKALANGVTFIATVMEHEMGVLMHQ